MKIKNILGFGVVAFFTYQGVSKAIKYRKGESDFDDAVSGIGKDAVNRINNIVTIFSDDQNEKDFCDGVAELTKKGMDVAVSVKRELYD